MIKKILSTTALCLTCVATLNAKDVSSDTSSHKSLGIQKELGYSNDGFEYDAVNGWWWYQQKDIDKNGQEINVKVKMTPKEKIDFEKDNELIILLKKQNNSLEEIKKKLEYVYPELTPQYSKNSKGETCVSNSSADCFVFPLQPEAQQVPVLAEWLKDPSPTNSKKYLQWQAKYFNHLQSISYGLRFAFLQDGPEAYPTDMTFAYGDNLAFPMSDDAANFRKLQILQGLKDKFGLVIFLGGNTYLEQNLDAYSHLSFLSKDIWKDINKMVVVPSESSKQFVESQAKQASVSDSWAKAFWDNVEIKVEPEMYQKMNIMITPSIAALYKTDNDDNIFQTILTGNIGEEYFIKASTQFLVYNKIINPADMAAAYNQGSMQTNMLIKPADINESKIFNDTKKLYFDKNISKDEK